MLPFEILYQDEYYIAINKPPGILVHKTRISEDKVFILQLLRDQIGQRVYPVHRLDRATSGVLLFGKSAEAASELGMLLMDKTVDKSYLAIVRGYMPEEGTIDYALADEESAKGMLPVPAITHFKKLGQSVIDAAIGLRYTTARFSLMEAIPETGRRHQIRKHFAHLRHPIICDSRHGDVKHNKYFREQFDMTRLLLHAGRLGFTHPFSQIPVTIQAMPDADFRNALDIVQLSTFLPAAYQLPEMN